MADDNSQNGAVNKASIFKGDRAKSQQFLGELYLYFLGNSKCIRIDDDKVKCALSSTSKKWTTSLKQAYLGGV
ncbi:uncharacterized protein FIBRA_09316 [Fibroporia radiculosa]|uniref:Uncharacterized protein n=1 Tax=Fibroporia radiculosa TaxID=599839 RepID=J7SCX5_9APHY|nr:uncharacterized protein FIBRA_09316 [Fibroporia radiculosa]CCM06998.1 predicted protein [Fibroporia radiculosa]